jgi:hypothetical protein
MNAWMNKSCAVSMESLVRVHAGLAMSASEIFGPRRRARWRPGAAGSVGTDSAASLPRHSVEARSRAGSLLDEALGAAQPPKLKDIAAAVGASTGFVRYWHSDKVAQLRERNLDIQRRERDARRDRHRREVGAAIEGLRAKGVFPGRKAVEAVVRARGTTLIEPDNYKAYRAAVLTRCS